MASSDRICPDGSSLWVGGPIGSGMSGRPTRVYASGAEQYGVTEAGRHTELPEQGEADRGATPRLQARFDSSPGHCAPPAGSNFLGGRCYDSSAPTMTK
jgi:hypothetical protein